MALGKAFFELVPKMKEQDVLSTLKAIKTDGMSKEMGMQLGKGLVKGFAALGVGKAIADTITASVKAYANYEQLVGGVETLFKDSAGIVQDYAANAYKTAGMSANQYMETVTSFSASLLQSLGGDTEAAAQYADMAITDMSDNANKMGTSMEAVQNAYQGFAKQNYTMLDNLKLGYGGTKTEMERLLADAEKLSGVKYDISNLNDVYEAIHVIQLEMGVSGYKVDELKSRLSSLSLTQEELNRVAEDWARDSKRNMTLEEARAAVMAKYEKGLLDVSDAQVLLGTTAREAELTLSGSFNQMKASWENFLVVLGDPNGDVEGAMKQLVGSMETVLKNAIPIIGNIIGEMIVQLPDAIIELAPIVLEAITRLMLKVGEKILEGLNNIFTDLGNWVAKVLFGVEDAGNEMADAVGNGVDQSVDEFGRLPIETEEIVNGLDYTDSGEAAGNSFAQGIRNSIGAVQSASLALVNAADAYMPHSPAEKGPFSGKGWTLYSGMAIAEGLAEGFTARIRQAQQEFASGMRGLATIVNGTTTNNAYNVSMNITADSETTLQSLVKQAQRARMAYGRA